jgi:hypothetical protein
VTLGFSAEGAMEFWLWASRLWPLLVPFLFLAAMPPPRAGAFILFGALACYGVQSVVGMLSIELPAAIPEGGSFGKAVRNVSCPRRAHSAHLIGLESSGARVAAPRIAVRA